MFNIKRKISTRTILMHAGIWLVYLGVVIYFLSDRFPIEWAIKRALFLASLQIPMVYLNMELLIPRFYLKKQYFSFVAVNLVILIVFTYLSENFLQPDVGRELFSRNPPPDFGGRNRRPFFYFRFIFGAVPSLILILISSLLKLSQIASKREVEAAVLRGETLNSELKFLKYQINPHFLFNTLNNVYTLSLIKSDKAPETILTLSEMLRYVLYECGEQDRVLISKEINYMNNYIALQKMRDSDIRNIEFVTNVEKDIMIAPMLFIPFVENSFKHSKIESTEQGWARFSLKSKGGRITFIAENSLSDQEEKKDAVGGIGIENVKRRLQLIYPHQHEINITSKDQTFRVQVEILIPA